MFNLNSSHALYMMSFCLFDCAMIETCSVVRDDSIQQTYLCPGWKIKFANYLAYVVFCFGTKCKTFCPK